MSREKITTQTAAAQSSTSAGSPTTTSAGSPTTTSAGSPATTSTSTLAGSPATTSTSTSPWSPLTIGALALAAVSIVATWCYLVFTQPTDTDWFALASDRTSAIALAGFTLPALLTLAVLVQKVQLKNLALMPVALALNIVLGQVIGTMGLPLPLYLDSIGTVLMGALGGPIAGIVTGICSALIWGTFNPTVVPFAAAYAFVGLAAGLLASLFRGAWWKLAVVAVGVGFITALLSAPIASFIFGGTAGTGTGLLVTIYRNLGFDPMVAVFLQSWTSDPLDKVIVFTVVWWVIRALPQRARREFAAAAGRRL